MRATVIDARNPTLKYAKIVAVIVVVLAIIAAVMHQKRESIVRKIANSALSEQGITATELSVDTIGTDRVRLSHILLEQDDGTRYEISDLSFPTSFPSDRARNISINQVVMTPAETETTSTPLSGLLQSFLQLPETVPNTEIAVSRFVLAEMPTIDNIVWRSDEQRQHLALSIQSVEIRLDIDRVNTDQHQATINAVVGGNPDSFSSTFTILRGDSGFSIEGTSTTDLAPWHSMLQTIGLLPDDVNSLDARIAGEFTLDLNDNEMQSVPVQLSFLLDGELAASYRGDDGSSAQLRTTATGPLIASFRYPELEWTAAVEQVELFTELESIGDISAQLNDVECQSGTRCSMNATMQAGPLTIDSAVLGGTTASASLVITSGETTRVAVAPDFSLALSGIETESFSIASLQTNASSPLQLTIDENGWHGNIDEIKWAIDSLTDGQDTAASLSIAFGQLQIDDSGRAFATEATIQPRSGTMSWDDFGFPMPGVNGTISLLDNQVDISLTVFNYEDTLSARVDVSHNTATGEGSMSVVDAALPFDRGSLSTQLLDWPFEWDIVSGKATTDLELNWSPDIDGPELGGSIRFRAEDLAGSYSDIVFSGLSTALTGTLDSSTGVTFLPSTISVALLEIGVPVEKISANFNIDIAEQMVQVEAVTMSALGGRLVTDPFQYHLKQERNDIVLRPESIQLQFMVDLAEFENIVMNGSISGTLPLTISANKLTITDGRLESDAPGGVIRYLPGLAAQDMGVPATNLGLVERALGNFQFDSLTSDVDYSENGDLKLQMRLTGVNPDMDDRQPVILNLGVENNIPQLLRSLQATRSIEDILERRSAK